MTAQTYDPSTRLDDLHPSRFLKVSDLTERWKVAQLTVTIARITSEETIPNPKDIDPETHKPRVLNQPVLYFQTKPRNPKDKGGEYPRGYLISAQVDIQSLKSATGAETIAELIGNKIIILVGEHRGKAVLRISAMPPEFPHVDGYVSSQIVQGKKQEPPAAQQTGEVLEATCKKCGMLAQVNPETQRFYSHQTVAGETCIGWAEPAT